MKKLAPYQKKRDFKITMEPKGRVTLESPHLYVMQKHAASHLHYDLRLEMRGVLKSWALPKGPSLDPKVKRLAIQVEDHPLEYGNFEGIIPKGQYGAGTVMLWDKGSWEPIEKHFYKAYEQGHLRFKLHAEKLNGRWDLIRFKEDNHWFLIKYQDEYARREEEYEVTCALDTSVVSNRTIESIAELYEKPKKIILPKGLNKIKFPTFFDPQLATLVDKPPEGIQWLHEVKLDGYRMLAFKNKSEVILKSRNNKDWSSTLPSIVLAIAQLPFNQIVLDGEVVVLDKEGRSDFQLLQNSLKRQKSDNNIPYYFIFDLLYFEGYDLRNLSLEKRKSLLKKVLENTNQQLQYNEHIEGAGQELYNFACNRNLEGIVSKQKDGRYLSHRSQDWLKIKCSKRQEFVIGGYSSPQGSRVYFGSLLLGVYNKEGKLHYVGNVGTGFKQSTLKEIYELLEKNSIASNPFQSKPPRQSTAHWVEPKLVCEVAFSEWTEEGMLRHPSFKGLRIDKKAKEVVQEQETPVEEVDKKKPSPPTFVLTKPDKILYAEDKISKQDLLTYYETVSELILPYLASRLLTLVRCTSHYQQCFYQRHHNKSTPKALRSFIDKQGEEEKKYLYLDNKEGLFSLVQMGVLEIHPWGSQIEHIEQPDILVFDLDPAPDVSWYKVVLAAKEVRDYLAEYQLISFVKTTGGKGLHIVVPIQPEYDWVEVKNFTHVFVQCLEKIKPKEYIGTMTKSKREGKIFIDYLRNQRAATAIGAYSTRARIHAPVSTPLFWEELSDKKEENTYTIKTLPKRLDQLKEDPWKNFWDVKQSLRLGDL